MRDKTAVRMNGKQIWIANFKRTDTLVSGRIHGNDVSILFPATETDKKAKRALVEESNRLYGDSLCPPEKRAKLGIAIKMAKRRVTESHIENLGNGVSRGVAKVDGEDVSILYTGTVTNDNGDIMTAKPYLGDFRKDAIKLKDKNKGKVFAFPDVSLVDNEFIQRLISEKNLMVKKGVVYIGSEKIKIANMKKVDAANAIKTAVERYNEETKQMETEVEKLLACF
jgi:F0F1-type ATP synthase epsilon subunit